MAINSNFDILEPEAWTDVARELQYPMKPMMRLAATNVAGSSIEGLVATKNKTVKVPRPVRVDESNVQTYTGSDPSKTTLNVENAELVINTHEITQFDINKRDEKFSLIDLVRTYLRPHLDIHARKINSKMKAEGNKFEAAFYDDNSGATVMSDADLREARRIILKRKFVDPSDGFAAVIDPDSEADLTGLDLFHQADQFGSRSTLLEGSIGRAFGFDFFLDNLGFDSSAADVGDAVVAAAASEGDTEITIDDGSAGASSADLDEGDLIYFASANGKDEIYVVDSATTTEITLKEPLRADVADDAAITAVPAGQVQYLYNPSALVLVTAGMESVSSNTSVSRSIGFDPVNNMNYTLSIQETIHGATVTIETLYGAKNFYEDYGVRYLRGSLAKA